MNSACKEFLEPYLKTLENVQELLTKRITLENIEKANKIIDKELYLLRLATGKVKQSKNWNKKE